VEFPGFSGHPVAEVSEPRHRFFYLVGYNDGWGSSGYGTVGVTRPRVVASGDCQ